jgi:ABC-type sugar transport system permease subunit
LVALAILDAFALMFLTRLWADEVWFLAVSVSVITLGLNVFFLSDRFYPFRWFSPGLALIILMVAYPIVYTLYISFTNYRDGNLLRQNQAIAQIENRQYLPSDAPLYGWTAFGTEDGHYALWLVADDGSMLFAPEDDAARVVTADDPQIAELDEDSIPERFGDYERLSVFTVPSGFETRTFGKPPETIKIETQYKAGQYRQQYVYDAAQEAMIDQATGVVYTANRGTFTAPDGSTLSPGYYVPIGLDNFKRLVTSDAIRGPFLRVFMWTFAHAILTVLITFIFGLGLALVLNDPIVPARRVLRSMLLIPYAIPGFISVLVWRGLLRPEFGVVNRMLEDVFGWAPSWFADPVWAKLGILLVQLWLGFPYMMLICMGALQTIPPELHEAAKVDGANTWQRFRNITLPLLLVTVGPLLIAAFAYNFNNFTVIRLYNQGGPPIPGTTTPAGHTDILLTYTYRLAFAGQRGADYSFATAITLVIFVLVAAITLFNFRFTGGWEEVSESV